MLKIDSKVIRNFIFKNGISTKDLAEKSGLSQPTITKIAYNDSPCTIKTIGKLATALNVDPEEIIKNV